MAGRGGVVCVCGRVGQWGQGGGGGGGGGTEGLRVIFLLCWRATSKVDSITLRT